LEVNEDGLATGIVLEEEGETPGFAHFNDVHEVPGFVGV
jgi:hypothetical protein